MPRQMRLRIQLHTGSAPPSKLLWIVEQAERPVFDLVEEVLMTVDLDLDQDFDDNIADFGVHVDGYQVSQWMNIIDVFKDEDVVT